MLARAFLISLTLHGILLVSSRTSQPLIGAGDVAPKSMIAVVSLNRNVRASPAPNPVSGTGQVRVHAPQLLTPREQRPPEARNLASLSASTATNAVAASKPAASGEHAIAPGIGNGTAQHDAVSLDVMSEYRLSLAREARRFKRYPQLARERGWEGVAVISVSTVAGALLPQVGLSQSTGFSLLDDAALELARQAVQVAGLPDALRHRQFAISLPIHYRLSD